MASSSSAPRTLYDKVFDNHVVNMSQDGTAIMYIDRHIVHEVTSPQAFEGLSKAGRKVRRTDCTLATVDHNVPTANRKNYKDSASFIKEADSRLQVITLEENVKKFGVNFFGMTDKRQGIVHVIGPEQGFTLPGATIVCGDSHTSTHGAFGALAFGIGTSEVEHVLATQTILQKKSKNMRVQIDGPLAEGVTSKDVMLHVIGLIGTAGGTGSVIEFCGTTMDSLSMEARMAMANMSIEGGARAGMFAPDETTFKYLKGKPMAPKGAEFDAAVEFWKGLRSDKGAHYDHVVKINAADIPPTVTWGTSPEDTVDITGNVPRPEDAKDEEEKGKIQRALTYMGLEGGMKVEDITITNVFIGSCTNSRIEDLRAAASVVKGRKVAENVYAMVVPGSGLVKQQAEKEGLDRILSEAGFDWREAGCSMCLGMNPDMLTPGQRCASTSNRNFEGRQGPGGRTHLMSPAMAAAAAIAGHLVDARKYAQGSIAEPAAAVDIGVDEDVPSTTSQPADAADDGVSQSDAAPDVSAPVTTAAAGMPKFEVVKGIAAPLERANIDTDLIIPARFLKTIKRTGLGVSLFAALRYNADGSENPDFILNKDGYRDSKILVVSGGNFGCGSSREHAPWALLDFGIRTVIASSFADIFNNNMYKNGSLPVILSEEQISLLLEDAKSGQEIAVDLPNQVVRRSNGDTFSFEVDQFRKHCLVNGLDEISLTLEKEAEILKYEQKRSSIWPWYDGKAYKGKIEQPKKTDWVAKIAVVYYTLYGHVSTLALAIAEAAKSTGAEVDIFRFPEILSDEVRGKMHAGPHLEYPEMKPEQLTEYDGFIFGFGTRYGRAPAAASAFFDQTGGLWAKGALFGKMATVFTSTASQHGGQETTALTTIPFFAHHGIIFVPSGFASPELTDLTEIVGGSAYGAAAIAGGDGSRQVTEKELSVAKFQGSSFAKTVSQFVAGKSALERLQSSGEPVLAKAVPTSATPAQTTDNSAAGYDVTDKAATPASAAATTTPVAETAAGTPETAAVENTSTPAATSTPPPAEKATPAQKPQQKKKGGMFSCCGKPENYES